MANAFLLQSQEVLQKRFYEMKEEKEKRYLELKEEKAYQMELQEKAAQKRYNELKEEKEKRYLELKEEKALQLELMEKKLIHYQSLEAVLETARSCRGYPQRTHSTTFYSPNNNNPPSGPHTF